MRGYVGASLHICSQVELYVYTPEGKRLNIKKEPAETLMYLTRGTNQSSTSELHMYI